MAAEQKFLFLYFKMDEKDCYEGMIISEGIVMSFCAFEKGTDMNHHKRIMKMILAALFLALAYVLPFLTGHISKIGSMLCPMHLPVLLCGFICGPVWGSIVGLVVPIFRSLTLGMPPLFPTALCMAFELAAYGAVAGIMHRVLPRKKPFIYCSLLTAMVMGRLVWGAAMYIVVGMSGGAFTLTAFITGAFTNAIPGIIAQIILVPVFVMLLENPNILRLRD
jgi:predicted membrane protein